MPVIFETLEEGRILIYTFTNPWAVTEFTAFYPQIKKHLDDASEKVQLLLDFTQTDIWNGNAFRARGAPFTNHPNMGYLAVINTSAFIEAVAEVLIRLGRTNYTRFFKTKDEGMEFLRSQL